MDAHCEMILDEYRSNREDFVIIRDILTETLKQEIAHAGIYVTGVEARIKEEKSLAGKLELKGYKYKSLADITDIVGARVITFYEDEVDKIAALVENVFVVDWDESVDKRKIADETKFGYMSLHYICRIPESLYYDENHKAVNEYRFEIQMRTAMQHVWATIEHDTGYKSDIEVPKEYLRRFSRMAGLLELVDDEFKRIRDDIEDYRNRVRELVKNGNLDEMDLNVDSFKSYLDIKPFDKLNQQMASINHAEIREVPLDKFLPILNEFGFKTLADVENMVKNCSEGAYKIVLHTYGHTDLDIISSSLALQNLIIVHIIENGGGEKELKKYYDLLYGERDRNIGIARRMYETITKLKLTK